VILCTFIEILNSRSKETASSIIYISQHIQNTQRQQQMPAVTIWAAAQNPKAQSVTRALWVVQAPEKLY